MSNNINFHAMLRSKWKKHIAGGDGLSSKDRDIAKKIETITIRAKRDWNSMTDCFETGCLWLDLPMKERSDNLCKNFRRLRDLALAYAVNGTCLHENKQLLKDLKNALEWMYQNKYNENTISYDNWWPWHIGIPQALNDIIILLYEEFTEEQIKKYMAAVEHFTPDPGFCKRDTLVSTGANRIDTAKVVAIRGIIVEDDTKVCMARDAISQIFEYVTSGDGFYSDGSFVQHNDIPYTCSYGMVLLDGLSELLNLLGGSPWEAKDRNVTNVYEWIYNSYEPLIYNGAAMDMTRGRAVSRHFLQDHNAGHVIIGAVARLAEFAPDFHKKNLRSIIKYWIQNDNCGCLYEDNNINTVKMLKEILDDSKCDPISAPSGNHVYANMDRVVHRRGGYALGISMYSKRIQNYEEMNDENKKAWYTSDGMTYLYTGDCWQYSNGFWPTVDTQKMPGTTVDTVKRTVEQRRNVQGGQRRSNKSWVGGASLNNLYGAAGMELDTGFSTLTARKSWFMFDREIVALGAGIKSADNRTIETIIQNYKIRDKGDNILIAEGKRLPCEIGWSGTVHNISWMYVEGNTKGSSTGYYFPACRTVKVIRERREGRWSEINFSEPDDIVSNNYIAFWLDHGKNPQNADYAYVILPNATEEETDKYAQNPGVEILCNSHEVQAVRNNSLGILAVNFWEDKPSEADIITCENKASVILREYNGFVELAVSDPTMENQGTIDVEIHREAYAELVKNSAITVKQLSPTIIVSVNVKDAAGKTFEVKFSKRDYYDKP